MDVNGCVCAYIYKWMWAGVGVYVWVSVCVCVGVVGCGCAPSTHRSIFSYTLQLNIACVSLSPPPFDTLIHTRTQIDNAIYENEQNLVKVSQHKFRGEKHAKKENSVLRRVFNLWIYDHRRDPPVPPPSTPSPLFPPPDHPLTHTTPSTHQTPNT